MTEKGQNECHESVDVCHLDVAQAAVLATLAPHASANEHPDEGGGMFIGNLGAGDGA
jgi:hypothetical protein